MSERDVPHEINRELFLDPALEIDDNEEFETLRRFHEEDAERDEEARSKNNQKP
ncbi:MAG TPA: hypothetical protein VGN11_05835 [Candidatus Baltobacteraceae bacterium]|jgi:hypothetical protein|nr:hypothetical protein [Candidatus Baltobacteraceae bacterium]